MNRRFKLKHPYKPSGDQPEAITLLVKGVKRGDRYQTLLGATGTGKTYTIANVIQAVERPTLVIAHNKTLAAQLCNEFREFFPDNAVEYFVSYYDYYQPEAYMPKSDTYIEKEAMINEEIDRLRHSATQALLTRRDVIICASVSCIYGLGAPEAYEKTVLHVAKGQDMTRTDVLARLIEMQFTRTNADLLRGTFRIRGGILELMPVNEEAMYRIEAPKGTIEAIMKIDPVSRKVVREQDDVWVFPAKHFITLGPERERAIKAIRLELKGRLKYFEKQGKLLEAERLERRTKFDLEMIENLGYCNGIENYSRHLSGRGPGEPPDTLLSYFPKGALFVIDESHVTVPQIGGMFEGDRSRKQTLIEYGFRLPSAADNRPLTFHEVEDRWTQVVFVSATPGPFELKSSNTIVEQIIRPTGLVDPEVIVRPVTGTGNRERGTWNGKIRPVPGSRFPVPSQIDDVISRIALVTKRGDRVLVTTLTKKMAEDLSEYLAEKKIKARYIHSDIKTIERLEILSDFRRGEYDVLVGVNLLREGLDLPEVALVAILDADKEGFLRSETSLIQTIGRAARNVRGQVVLYADVMTGSMKRAIKETDRRRAKQVAYNEKHGITPQTIIKAIKDIRETLGLSVNKKNVKEILKLELSAETHDLKTVLKKKEEEMKQAAKDLEFELAAILRDEMSEIIKEIKKREKTSPVTTLRKPPRHGRTR
ncbi:excinuclease ABC subunit B [Candidatus Uhrbacteria bacterium RIFCSPHIGHO2_12_FULL_60_25]|uniref:UvrABC system protein B n=1 Tax=Candidatus Uhrbacteria bacterium RIFCSPHIGHO2_12_FULL_60_25 TaxID=1802399 RepID=A0A1F7UIK3_9BACT|nr:MAG: excinuclease ABC subunit B [Candidatus Uhrbacteria bacterium RIFCSPHIGHO2_02_FULL_60_44]OGL78111.1 MAG: excinuclease ABC subunit B [Candidatus Uhrbacteria bacterium RIFCSPHIGHO2_12_FULL_60_25]